MSVVAGPGKSYRLSSYLLSVPQCGRVHYRHAFVLLPLVAGGPGTVVGAGVPPASYRRRRSLIEATSSPSPPGSTASSDVAAVTSAVLSSPRGLHWSDSQGLFIADSGSNKVCVCCATLWLVPLFSDLVCVPPCAHIAVDRSGRSHRICPAWCSWQAMASPPPRGWDLPSTSPSTSQLASCECSWLDESSHWHCLLYFHAPTSLWTVGLAVRPTKLAGTCTYLWPIGTWPQTNPYLSAMPLESGWSS